MEQLITSDYRHQLILLHASRNWGASGYSHALVVSQYRKMIKAKTILDFGCGRATLKDALLKIDENILPENILEYDPAIDGKDQEPKPADLLVANDVLEHIEPDKLEATLKYIRSLALKGAYFTIALEPSKVFLLDGRNAHLIIKPLLWWIDKLREAGFDIVKFRIRKGLWVWAK